MEIPSVAYFNSKENAEDLIGQQERELVKRCQSGSSQAMEQIVYRYQDQVYNIAYGILGNAEDAKDITQDVFLHVWAKVGQFRFRSRFSTWLYRIVINLCRNEMGRRRHRALPTEMDDSEAWIPTESRTPEKAVLLKEQQEILHAALNRLKEKQREILILREMEELSYEEIAEVMGCSLGRVKSRLHEARMQLRKILKQR
jgi:RNA polymerase sigma-70 factor (ECF subfamily)